MVRFQWLHLDSFTGGRTEGEQGSPQKFDDRLRLSVGKFETLRHLCLFLRLRSVDKPRTFFRDFSIGKCVVSPPLAISFWRILTRWNRFMTRLDIPAIVLKPRKVYGELWPWWEAKKDSCCLKSLKWLTWREWVVLYGSRRDIVSFKGWDMGDNFTFTL